MTCKEIYQTNPELYRKRAREYAKKYPERVAITRFKHSHQIREMLRMVKTQKPCVDCGKRYPHYVMEFDHIDKPGVHKITGKRIKGVGSLTAQRWAVVLKELEKCEVVCANCHRIRTWNRQYAGGDWGEIVYKKNGNKKYRIRKCVCFGTEQQEGCAICGGVGALSIILTAEGEVAGDIARPKTKCVHGHAYTEENTVWHRDGHRECRKCKAESARKNHQKAYQKLIVGRELLYCLRCGHEWYKCKQVVGYPVKCPHCAREDWRVVNPKLKTAEKAVSSIRGGC